MTSPPSPRLRRFMALYTLLWWALLPVALLYLWWRGRRDPLYAQHLKERFGVYDQPFTDAVWVHAVSIGELRSAVPVIRAMLDRDERVVITTFTPAGRREAERIFADAIAEKQVQVAWVPLEFSFAFNRFFDAFTPKLGLVMEIEIWPRMILSARQRGVPLYLCNAQYPKKSFERDKTKSRWRFDLHACVAGALVKSDIQRDRFAEAGVKDIAVTGELRFDQPIPDHLVTAGKRWKAQQGDRLSIAIPSVVEGEDDTYIATIKALAGPDAPLFIYIPRAPERFDLTAEMLHAHGLKFARRSEVFDADLSGETSDIDVLLGDSFGEMYFYLAACDLAIIGGGFVEKGAHNISEPLVLGKPCVVGPHTWTVEFPAIEAMQAGVLKQVPTGDALTAYLKARDFPSPDTALQFASTQRGATRRTIEALEKRGLI